MSHRPFLRTLPLGLVLALAVPAFATAQASEPDAGDQAEPPPPCACDGEHPGRGHGRHGPPSTDELRQHLEQRLARMTEELHLRPQQVERIRAIFADAVSQMEAHLAQRAQGQRPTREQRRAHMQARFAIEERVAAVLDREQLLRMLSMRHQHMLEGRGRRGGHGRGRANRRRGGRR